MLDLFQRWLEARRARRAELDRLRRKRAAWADFIARDEQAREARSLERWQDRELRERRRERDGPWLRSGRGEQGEAWIRVPWSSKRL